MANDDGADLKAILQSVILDMEALMSSIDQKLTNNHKIDEKERKMGPYINDSMSKVLFTVRSFAK